MSKSNAQCGMGCPCCSQQHHTHEHGQQHEHTHEHNHEHSHSHASSKWMPLRVLASVALCIGGFLTSDIQWVLSLCFYAASTLIMGWEVLVCGIKGLFTLHFDEETLMSIAVIAAFAINEPFEGALVTILFCLGLQFENFAANRSQKNIQDLS